MVSRMGRSWSGLGITEFEIGPFCPNLVHSILWYWTEYLPGTYLQHHRSWAFSYLHFASFSRISEKLVLTTDPILRDANVQDHWKEFLEFLKYRPVFYVLNRILTAAFERPSVDFTPEMVLEDYSFRVGVIGRNPVRYNHPLDKYTF